MSSNISLVIEREYFERVKKKSFILTTLLMPLFMVAMMVAPAWIMSINTSGEKNIAVVAIGDALPVAKALNSSEMFNFQIVNQPLDSLMADDSYDGILQIGQNIVSQPDDARLYTRDAASIEMIGAIERQLSDIIENQRIEAYGINDLKNIIQEVQVSVTLPTSRITDTNEATESSSLLSTLIGFGMTFVLYMFLMLYGQMVMASIIEEKNNRVLEIMVSSVRPTQLMMGKILGVGLVALTQVLIWAILISVFTIVLMPFVLPADLLGEVTAYSAGTLDTATTNTDLGLIQAIATLSTPSYILMIFGYMILFLLGGFLLYAAMNAAIGSAVDNAQDAGQLQAFAMVPILFGLIFSMGSVTDPNSTMSIIFSFIPFTSPMVMLARVPFGIPAWQIWVSLALLYISFAGMVWVAAKIYRIGIFMYGKKPSIKELIRWIQYK